ncbi:N-acetyltransferase [Cohnella faecalis]|nr:hypothetical protein [Cohnella faecalis]
MVGAIRQWAKSDGRVQGIIVEVEAEDNEENRSRIRFWERCGFTLTDYVHRYVWVPETYRAMYAKLDSDSSMPEDGKRLFGHITSYHNRAFRK